MGTADPPPSVPVSAHYAPVIGAPASIRVLGDVTVLGPGPERPLGPAQQRLLALFVVHAGRALTSERLIDLLWGDDPPATASAALRVHVMRLRDRIEPRRERQQPSERLPGGAAGYVLLVDAEAVDAWRFEDALRRATARVAEGRLGDAATLLQAALVEWRGPAFGDLERDHALAPSATRLEDLRRGAQELLVRVLLDAGRDREVVERAVEWLGEDPGREALAGDLAVACYRLGRQREALGALRTTMDHLRHEYGLEPTPSLLDLERRVLDHDDALRHVRPRWGLATTPVGVAAHEEDLPGRTPLIERLAARVAAGTSGIVIVEGEAGIGKTAVLQALATKAPPGALVAVANGSGASEGSPVAVQWAQALEAHGARLAGVGLRGGTDPGEVRDSRLMAWRREVTAMARDQRVALLVDDVHEVTSGDIDLVTALVGAHIEGVLVVATRRAPVDALRDPLAAALAEAERAGRGEVLHLGPLPADAALPAAALLGRGLLRRADPVIDDRATAEEALRLAGGNPLLLGHVIRHVTNGGCVDETPPDTARFVTAELMGAPPVARRLLYRLAAVGTPVDLRMAAGCAGGNQDVAIAAIEEGLARGLLRGAGGGRFSFAHELVRTAMVESLAVGEVAADHRLIADVLAALPEAPPQAVAAHLDLAGDLSTSDESGSWWVRAGDAAMEALSFADAVTAYERSLERCDSTSPCWPARAIALGRALGALGDAEEAQAWFRRALDRGRMRGDPLVVADAVIGLAGPFLHDGPSASMLGTLLEGALSGLPPRQAEREARLAVLLASVRHAEGDRAGEEALITRGQVAAQLLREPGLLVACAIAARRLALANGRPASLRRAPLERTAAELGHAGDPLPSAQLLEHLVVEAWASGDVVAGDAHARSLATLADDHHLPTHRWWAQVLEASIHLRRETPDAGAAVERAFHGAPRGLAPVARRAFEVQTFVHLFQQGELALVEDLMVAPPAGGPARVVWDAARASVVAELRSTPPSADVLTAAAREPVAAAATTACWLALYAATVSGDVPVGAVEAAARLQPVQGEVMTLDGGAAVLGPVDLVLGRLAARRGDHTTAARLLGRAAGTADRADLRYWVRRCGDERAALQGG